MDLDWQAIGSFVAGLLGGGGGWKVISSFIDKWHTKKNKQAVEDIVAIYDAMQDIMNNTEMKRVLVMATHNDGAEIKPGSKLYTSVAYEQTSAPFKSVKNLYQNVPLDAEYVQMLLGILTDGRKKCYVDKMPSGVLQTIYQSEGVKYTEIYYLTDTERKKIWYLSCSTDKDIKTLPGYQNLIISKRVDQIAKLLKKHSKA